MNGMEWWTRWDSNPRPPRCERGALPAELLAHRLLLIITIITNAGRSDYVRTREDAARLGRTRAGERALLRRQRPGAVDRRRVFSLGRDVRSARDPHGHGQYLPG